MLFTFNASICDKVQLTSGVINCSSISIVVIQSLYSHVLDFLANVCNSFCNGSLDLLTNYKENLIQNLIQEKIVGQYETSQLKIFKEVI